ncbi:hypothetical protein NHX12_019621 [Muraenolepis orangiensis]|uniref:SH3 domain-containing protein n=1 Tax=Muraenolepis orangiensis TaxID=630683 RepID=A0A9Q0ETY3_9TELE|nr:hypothetical protein NHX12_019621 [Muraenolepis orangiensis]
MSVSLYCSMVVLLVSPYPSWSLMSDHKLCGDPECETLMSRVQATRTYHGKDCRFLSFTRGETILVYHKLTGRREDLWAGSIDKRFGYFPHAAVKEEQVYATAEKVVETQKFDFFCLDENGYPIDSSHLETDEDDGNVDEDDDQGNQNSETRHGDTDTNMKEGGSHDTVQDLSQSNHQGGLFEGNGHTEHSATTLENMDAGDGSRGEQGPNEKGGSPSSSSSSWFGSTVTGLLGTPRGSEHAQIDNTAEEDEVAKAEGADNSLTSSVTQWLGFNGQGDMGETTLGHEKEDEERTEKGETDGILTSAVNSWLSYGNGRTEDAEKSVEAEIELVEGEGIFRSRKMALDLESHQLQEDELAVPGTFDWLGDTFSSTIGFGPTRQDSGLEETTDEEEEEVKPSQSHSWYDVGIGDVLGFGYGAGNTDSTVESGLKEKGDDIEKHTELQNMETSPSQNEQDMKEHTNLHNMESYLSPPPQHNDKAIITDNTVETKTDMLAAGVNSGDDSVSSVSNTRAIPLERGESKMETELRDTGSLSGDSDHVLDDTGSLSGDSDHVLDDTGSLSGDSDHVLDDTGSLNGDSDHVLDDTGSLSGDSDHVLDDTGSLSGDSDHVLDNTGSLSGDSDHVLDNSSMLIADNESEVSHLDEVITLKTELEKDPSDRFLSELDNVLSLDEEGDDDNEEADTKEADEKDYPDLSQYSLRTIENNEGSVEAVFDGNADTHEEGNTESGTLNPGIEQTKTPGHQILAPKQFQDKMQQSQGDNTYEGAAKEMPQATDHGLNTLEAEELGSSHRETLSDRVAKTTEETKMNKKTYVNSAGTQEEQAVQTNAAHDQPSSQEAGGAQHMQRYSDDNKSSFPSPDIHTPGIADQYTNIDTIDQSSGPPPMSGSSEHSGNDADSQNVVTPKILAETDDEHPITEFQTADESVVFEKESFKSSTVGNTISDSFFKENSPFFNMANIKEETQVESLRKEEGNEKLKVEEETEVVVKLQIGDNIENIDEGEDDENLGGNPAMENPSSVIRDNESRVPAKEGMNQDQVTPNEPHSEGGSEYSMVTVKATNAGAGEAIGNEESPKALDVQSEVKRGYVEKDNHVEGNEEGREDSDTLRDEQEKEEHPQLTGSESEESKRSFNSSISEHIRTQSKSQLHPDDKVHGLFVSQTEIVKEEEDNVHTTSPGGLFDDIVINPKDIYEQKLDLDLDTPAENNYLNNVVPGPTKEFEPEDNDQLSSGVATFLEPSTGEMTNSDQQPDITDQGTIGKEGTTLNSENYDGSTIEPSDSTNRDDSKISAVFLEQDVFIKSMEPTPTVENEDAVKPERGGGAFGMFTNAFTYFSRIPSDERQDLKPNPDSSNTEKMSQPEGSLNVEQVTHVIEDTTPGNRVVPDTPASFYTLQVQHQETSVPLPSAHYQSQPDSESCSPNPTSEVPIKAGTATSPKRHKALCARFSVEETALLTELFGLHKLQWLDFILSNPESLGEDMDNDLSILLDMESLLHYHVDKLAQRQDKTQTTRELSGLKKLSVLLARVKDILNTGKSDVNTDHEDDTSTSGLSRAKGQQTAVKGEPRRKEASSESESEKTSTSPGNRPAQIGEQCYATFKNDRLEKDLPAKKCHDPMEINRLKTSSGYGYEGRQSE